MVPPASLRLKSSRRSTALYLGEATLLCWFLGLGGVGWAIGLWFGLATYFRTSIQDPTYKQYAPPVRRREQGRLDLPGQSLGEALDLGHQGLDVALAEYFLGGGMCGWCGRFD